MVAWYIFYSLQCWKNRSGGNGFLLGWVNGSKLLSKGGIRGYPRVGCGQDVIHSGERLHPKQSRAIYSLPKEHLCGNVKRTKATVGGGGLLLRESSNSIWLLWPVTRDKCCRLAVADRQLQEVV